MVSLTTLGLMINNDLRNDWDSVVSVTGMEGVAKSTFAIQLCAKIDKYFRLKNNITYRYDNLVDKVYGLPKYAAIMADEMGLIAFSREAMTKANRDLVKALMVCRDQNKALVLCIPNFWFLDSYVRNHRTTYWIHLPQIEIKGNRIRGFAEVRRKKENRWGNEPYWQKLGVIRFDRLPEEIEKIYKEQKREAILKEIAESMIENDLNPRDKMIVEWAKDGKTDSMIAEMLPTSFKCTRENIGQRRRALMDRKEGSPLS